MLTTVKDIRERDRGIFSHQYYKIASDIPAIRFLKQFTLKAFIEESICLETRMNYCSLVKI